MLCVERGVLSIYTRSKSGAMAILGVKSQGAPPQHAHMPPPIEGMAERCRWGSPAPKGQPPPDQAPLPPPSCGGLWAGPGSLLGWYFARMMKVDGHFYYSFARINVGKRLSMKFSMHLCLCPTK